MGKRLFMIVETDDKLDWTKQMKKLSTLPKQQEWEFLMEKYQQRLTEDSDSKWQPMKNIFKLTNCK